MSLYVFQAVLFLLTIAVQIGGVASLPEPYRLFPLALVMGVITLHERSLAIGAIWIALAGVVLELRGLGSGLAFAGVVAATAALALAMFVFAKRSFWALMGVGLGTAVAYVAARILWLLGLVVFFRTHTQMGVFFQQGLTTVLLACLGVFVFGAYIRRFLRWSRDKFVNKEDLYAISLPR